MIAIIITIMIVAIGFGLGITLWLADYLKPLGDWMDGK